MDSFENLLGELEGLFDDNGRDTGEVAESSEREDGAGMAKSLKFKLDDGTEVDAVDGAPMLNALMARAKRGAAALTKMFAILDARGDMIKSIQGDVERLSVGRGAKAEIAKSATGDVSPDEFFVKALTAQAEGKLSGDDIARAESHLNHGLSVPIDIVAKVYGGR